MRNVRFLYAPAKKLLSTGSPALRVATAVTIMMVINDQNDNDDNDDCGGDADHEDGFDCDDDDDGGFHNTKGTWIAVVQQSPCLLLLLEILALRVISRPTLLRLIISWFALLMELWSIVVQWWHMAMIFLLYRGCRAATDVVFASGHMKTKPRHSCEPLAARRHAAWWIGPRRSWKWLIMTVPSICGRLPALELSCWGLKSFRASPCFDHRLNGTHLTRCFIRASGALAPAICTHAHALAHESTDTRRYH